MNQQGKAIIFSAPSGAGKTTIVKALIAQIPSLEFSVSACSREKREYEQHGRDYYFIGVDEFRKKIADDDFLEWEEVYANNFYGTLKNEIDRIWQKGHHVIFDVDVEGGINLKKIFGANALSVFVMAPSLEELKSRLISRNTETPESLARRLNKAEKEMSKASQFDVILRNDDVEIAINEAVGLVNDFIKN
jgi:guanylate kinase